MKRLRVVYSLISLLSVAPLAARAQVQGKFPPDSFINLKIFPKTIPMRELVGNMRGFTRALGVRCTFCHVGEENIPLGKYDFASDDKPTKRKAREMLKMVAAINEQHLAKLEKRVEPPLNVQCATCHRGVSQPRPLAEILLAAYQAAGIDSTLTTYNALRDRYYGRAAYDFGEVTLSDVADGANAAGHLPDAVRLLELNVQLLPKSAFAQRQHASRAVELAFDQQGPEAGTALYKDLKSKYLPMAVTEETLNTVGYALLGRGRLTQAVAAFKLNAETFPQSANAYDSMAEGLAAVGDTAAAITSYQRAMAINPQDSSVVKKLAALKPAPAKPASKAGAGRKPEAARKG